MNILLLDVDGTVVPWADSLPKSWSDWKNEPTIAKDRGGIWWSRTMVDELWNTTQSRQVEIRWLTAWGEGANKSLCPLFEWPSLFAYVSETKIDEQTVFPWKKSVVDHLLGNGHRVCWADDIIGSRPPIVHPNYLGVGTHGTVGITPSDLTTLSEFFREGIE